MGHMLFLYRKRIYKYFLYVNIKNTFIQNANEYILYNINYFLRHIFDSIFSNTLSYLYNSLIYKSNLE